MLDKLLKLIILFTKNQFFSVKFLREIRWTAYRLLYNSPRIYVADNVTIVKAHKSAHTFNCGKETHIGKDTYIDYSGGIYIADHVAFSEGVKVFTHNHDINGSHKNWQKNKIIFSSLKVEKFVWLGASSIILPSVKLIAEGSIVAAGAVLTKDTEPYCIYAGNPAKKIGTRIYSE